MCSSWSRHLEDVLKTPSENEDERHLQEVFIKTNVCWEKTIKNFFDEPIKNDKITYENIRKVATGEGNDYTTGCLLDYAYLKNYYQMIAIDLSKQQELDADPRAVQQIDFTANLDGNTIINLILEAVKETVLDFSQGIVKVL